MKAVLRCRDFEDHLWCVEGEVRILKLTEKSIKIKRRWWSLPKWYPRFGMALRFEILQEDK